MTTRLFAIGLASVLLMAGRPRSAIASAETTAEVQSANVETPRREPIVGLGLHPGNFIGPLAFDVIVCPWAHLAFDLQVGYWSLENNVRGLGVGPQLQWRFLRGWQTPYMAALFRYEEVWSDGVRADSKGGALIGGWQFRWQSGIGLLLGVGVLYMSSITLSSPSAGYYSSGGTYGTYEVGVRYFF